MTTTPVLLDALARLNQISTAINQSGSDGQASFKTVLCMIAESATRVVPGASAVIYTYNESRATFDLNSRVSAEPAEEAPETSGPPADAPRPDGLGRRAVEVRRRVLSYEEPDLEINPAKLALGAHAMACYPILFASQVLGVLYIYLHEARRFSELELLMLENFVNLTAITLSMVQQNAQAQQETARKERELRRLRRAGMLISSRSSLKATLETILQVALEVTDAIYGIFRLVDRSGKNLVTQAISGVGLEKPAVELLPINSNSIMGTVALKREPVIVSDLRAEPWKNSYYPFDRELEMRSELAVPLIGASGRLEGVLNLELPNVNAFDRQDRYILQILATQAVVAIQEARLLDALQTVSALLTHRAPEEVHQNLVTLAGDLLNVPFGMIWLVEKNELLLQSASDPALVGMRLPLEGTLTGQVIAEGSPAAVLNGSDQPDDHYPDLPRFHGPGAALIMPLSSWQPVGVPVVGAFSVYTGQGELRDFDQSDWDKKVLDILGHYAVLAMQSAAQKEALRVAEEQRATTEAFAAIGDIAANLLHRLNNKIGTIPVRVEGIQDKCEAALASDAYLEKNLTEIEHSATEAMQVVRDSLFHLHPIQLSPVSVASAVHEALAASRLPPEVRVQIAGLEQLPPVQAGHKRLELVFLNLFDNAADAMGGRGAITVSGSAAAGWVQLAVSDNGPGIAPDIHERIFEFNYSARSSSHPGRLGFGLWWVKSLMARFGGTVTVESDGHSGTTFLLSLPQAREDAWQMDAA